jgi:predicted GNAT family acetyltransferase
VTRVELYRDASQFLDACLPWLMRKEDFNNGIISTALLVRERSHIFSPPYLFASILDGFDVLGCVVHVEPDGILVSELPIDDVPLIATYIRATLPRPSRISGDAKSSERLTSILEQLFDTRYSLEQTWNVYRLDKSPEAQPSIPGFLRLCDASERALVKKWSKLYAIERSTPIDTESFFLRKLDEKLMYAWDLNGPQAIATISAPTSNGIKISAVFTPANARGSGFATAIVSELSKRLLGEKYTFVTLSAEDGHDSERMYRAIGFRKIGIRSSFAAECTSHADSDV